MTIPTLEELQEREKRVDELYHRIEIWCCRAELRRLSGDHARALLTTLYEIIDVEREMGFIRGVLKLEPPKPTDRMCRLGELEIKYATTKLINILNRYSS